ncbi:MAG: Grx4 family monothiol glutaredoxin [Bdellovibrionota bacterium]
MTNEDAVHKFIKDEITSNDIVVFMKGTPDFPMCGFSGRVVQILNHFRRPFKGINILEDESLRQGVKTFSNWPTVPQIYVKGDFVGGCDIAMEMAQSGELEQLFNEKLGPAKT